MMNTVDRKSKDEHLTVDTDSLSDVDTGVLIMDQEKRDETLKNKSCFDSLTEAPTFFPTKEEFDDPIEYIAGLERQVGRKGICKIKLPSDGSQAANLDSDARYIATERMIVSPLHSDATSEVKQPDCNQKGVTLGEVRELSNSLLQDLNICGLEDVNALEANFWSSLSRGSARKPVRTLVAEKNEETTVERDSSLLRAMLQVKTRVPNSFDKIYLSKQKIIDSKRSLFRRQNLNIKGSSRVYEYAGLPFVTWNGLKQTLPVCSVDCLRAGGPKVWYSVHESDAVKLEKLCQREMQGEGEATDTVSEETVPCNNQDEANSASCVLDDIVSSGQLLTHLFEYCVATLGVVTIGIVLVRTVQQKNDLVVTFPQSNHFGVSLGWMVGESIAFAISEWFPMIRKGLTTVSNLCNPYPIPYEELLTMEAVSVGEALKKMWCISSEGQVVVTEEYNSFIEQLRRQQSQLQAKGCKRLKLDWPYGSNPCSKCKRSCFLSFVLLKESMEPFCLGCALKEADSSLHGGVVAVRRRQELFEALASKLWRYRLSADQFGHKRNEPSYFSVFKP